MICKEGDLQREDEIKRMVNELPYNIRKKYATSVGENAVHGSDSDENAAIEGAFHFAGREQF